MAKSERQVDIAITARDEASSVFKSVAAQAREFNMEAKRSGEGAVERLLKGGGALGLATFALEGAGHAAKAFSESLAEVANGERSVQEGFGHMLEGVSGAVPVLGTWVTAFREIENAGFDAAASIAAAFGADKATQEAIESSDTLKAHYEALSKAIYEGEKLAMAGKAKATIAGLTGIERERAEANKAYQEELDHIEQLRKEKEKGLDADGKRAADKGFNQARIEAENALNQKLAELSREAADQKEENQLKHLERVKSQEDLADEVRLRERGRDLEADLVALTAAHEKELAEIDRLHQKQKLSDQQAKEERAAADEAFEARSGEAREKDAAAKLERNDSINQTLNAAKLAALKEQAAMGDQGAAAEARKWEISLKYTAEKEKLIRLLRDEKGLTDAQHAAAIQALGDLEKARNKELESSKVEPQENRKAALEESSQLAGVSASQDIAKEHLQTAKDLLDEAKKNNDTLTQAAADIATMVGYLDPSNATSANSVFGDSQ